MRQIGSSCALGWSPLYRGDGRLRRVCWGATALERKHVRDHGIPTRPNRVNEWAPKVEDPGTRELCSSGSPTHSKGANEWGTAICIPSESIELLAPMSRITL